MRLSNEEILEKIETLEPLLLERDFTQIHDILSPHSEIQNHEILQGLEQVYNISLENTPDNTRSQLDLGITEGRSHLNPEKTKPEKAIPKTSLIGLNYYETTLGDLTHRFTDSLFTPQFMKTTKEILKGKTKEDMTKEEIIKLNDTLQSLSTVEFE
jgi:hypothetical protein